MFNGNFLQTDKIFDYFQVILANTHDVQGESYEVILDVAIDVRDSHCRLDNDQHVTVSITVISVHCNVDATGNPDRVVTVKSTLQIICSFCKTL